MYVVYTLDEGIVFYLTLSRKGVARWTDVARDATRFRTQKDGLRAAILPRLIAADHGEMTEIVCRKEMGRT